MDKICKGCGIKFITTNHRQLFHNHKCCIFYNIPIQTKKTNERNQKIYKSTFSKNIKKRKCLSCNHIFISEGKWNKICCDCKRKPEFTVEMNSYVN